jgi:uncharacterized protein YjbI with pentapeptide repeats
MANEEHVAMLKQGVDAWNKWRKENPDICPDLRGATVVGADLRGADLRAARLAGADLGMADMREANLSGAYLLGTDLHEARLGRADISGAYLRVANLSNANLDTANLRGADLNQAKLGGADLRMARLGRVNLSNANLSEANLASANLSNANLSEANLSNANLSGAMLDNANLTNANLSRASLRAVGVGAVALQIRDPPANLSELRALRGWKLKPGLCNANLSGANLSEANLSNANLSGANLSGAILEEATLVDTDLTGADLTDCRIYGVSAWGLNLEGTQQHNLVITREDEPTVTVDDIEVAQFIYLMLHNQKIRKVIDTITSKAVLILGRFTDKRKAVLDALREELRKRDYLPILFDFEVPATRDITETVSLLARMARFIIADLTDPSSIPKELEAIVPGLAVPVQPLLEGSSRPYAMFKDYWKYEWVLPVYRYEGLQALLTAVAEKVIAPAEGKVKALQERRRMIEAELTKPQ